MPDPNIRGVRSRTRWLKLAVSLSVLAGVVIAAAPKVVDTVSAALHAQEIAAATDPATGRLRIESAPMQCANACSVQRNEARTVCGGYRSSDELQRRGIPAPDGNCDAAMVAKYSACMAGCGFTVPNSLRVLRGNEISPPGPPALGSPEELALRRSHP